MISDHSDFIWPKIPREHESSALVLVQRTKSIGDLAIRIMDYGIGFDLNDHTGLVQPAFNAASDRVNAPKHLAMRADQPRSMFRQAGQIGSRAYNVAHLGPNCMQGFFNAAKDVDRLRISI